MRQVGTSDRAMKRTFEVVQENNMNLLKNMTEIHRKVLDHSEKIGMSVFWDSGSFGRTYYGVLIFFFGITVFGGLVHPTKRLKIVLIIGLGVAIENSELLPTGMLIRGLGIDCLMYVRVASL